MIVSLLETWFNRLYDIGADSSGGVTRLGYSAQEDRMHEALCAFAASLGLCTRTDRFGNTFVSFPDGATEGVHLMGSHLDSVPQGGRYDGVVGVLAGLLVMHLCQEEGVALPIETVGFRCEESSAFDQASVGSALMLGLLDDAALKRLKNADGERLYDVLAARGAWDTVADPEPKGMFASRYADYIEVHIEQGRVLEEYYKKIGIVTAIAGPHRFRISLAGRQDHSGATPMLLRRDALCGAAEVVLAVEAAGRSNENFPTVATVGVLRNEPNTLNVVPGAAELRVDVRGVDKNAIVRTVVEIQNRARRIARRRKLRCGIETISYHPPVELDEALCRGLAQTASEQGCEYLVMHSGAGHDAMVTADIVPSAMVFIPCKDGVSHNAGEYAELGDIARAATLVYEFLKKRG